MQPASVLSFSTLSVTASLVRPVQGEALACPRATVTGVLANATAQCCPDLAVQLMLCMQQYSLPQANQPQPAASKPEADKALQACIAADARTAAAVEPDTASKEPAEIQVHR